MPAEVTAQQLLMLAQGYIGGRAEDGEWILGATWSTPVQDKDRAIHALVVLARRYPKHFNDLAKATGFRELRSIQGLARRVDEHIKARLEARKT